MIRIEGRNEKRELVHLYIKLTMEESQPNWIIEGLKRRKAEARKQKKQAKRARERKSRDI